MRKTNKGLNTALWQNNYDDVSAYLSEHNCGIGDIPDDAVNRNGKSLKRWVYEMKKACRGNSRYKLTKEQLRLLKQLGINDMLSATETIWYAHFNDLLQFYSENHHLNIPRSVLCSDGTILLLWTRQQRGKYQKHTLSERYVDEFRKHGLMEVLETPLDIAMWHVEEYYKEHGNIDFDTSYVCPDGYKLGIWLRTIREKYLGNKNKRPYPQEVIDRLNEMGIVWSKKKDRWHKCFQECREYLDAHEGYMIPDDLTSEDGINIKNWLVNNKKMYKNGELSGERAKLLESIHFLEITTYTPVSHDENAEIFKSKSGQMWLANYMKCKEYLAQNGGTHLPIDMQTVSGTPMNKWLYVNRKRYKSGSLPKAKAELLEAIDIEDIHFKNTESKKKCDNRSDNAKRTKTLHIKITEKEHAKIRSMTKGAGYAKVSDYVRDRLLKGI